MRRESRERYRVYSADEFLAALAVERDDASALPGDAAVARSNAASCARRRTRVAGATLLIGAIGSVGGLTAASLTGGQRHARTRRQDRVRMLSGARAAARLGTRVPSAPRNAQSSPPTSGDRHVRRSPRAASPHSRTPGGHRARRTSIEDHAELAAVRPSAGEPPSTPVVAHGPGEEFGFER